MHMHRILNCVGSVINTINHTSTGNENTCTFEGNGVKSVNT